MIEKEERKSESNLFNFLPILYVLIFFKILRKSCFRAHEGPKAEIEAEVIFRYEGQTESEHIGIYDSNKKAVEEITDTAWEDETPLLKQSLIILRNTENQEITAVGVYLPGVSTRRRHPLDLLWICANGRHLRTYCEYCDNESDDS